MSEARSTPIRVLIAKPGLDGHDRGAKVLARGLRDEGFEVIYTGLRQTPEMIADAAEQEDVDVVGLSILSGAHMALLPRTVQILRERGMDDVLAVDPSSPYTGGAILGDRIRMMEHAADRDVFVRSMASRGELGGLAATAWIAAAALDAAGYDPILIETVGAGQSEVEVARVAETTVVVEVPEMGDEIQAIKAGLLEIADIVVVNKADRPGADRAARQLRAMLSTAGGRVARKPPPIMTTTATTGEGVAALADAVDAH